MRQPGSHHRDDWSEVSPELIARTERWFGERGTPTFVARAASPASAGLGAGPSGVVLLFLAEGVAVRHPDWPPGANLVAVTLGVGLLAALRLALRRWRGHRGQPEHRPFDPLGAAVFLLVPVALQLLFGGQLVGAGKILLLNAVVLCAVKLGGWAGLGSVVRWSARELCHEPLMLIQLLARAAPLLLLSTMLLFMTAEVWQAISGLTPRFYDAIIGLLIFVSGLFIVTHAPREVEHLTTFASPDEVVELCRGSTLAEQAPALARAAMAPHRLGGCQRANLALLVVVSLGIQIALVTCCVYIFYVLFGLLALRPELFSAWTGQSVVQQVVTFPLLDRDVQVTRELLWVSGFVAAYTCLYFSVYVIQDQAYREEFFARIVREFRQNCAVRAVYLALLERGRNERRE